MSPHMMGLEARMLLSGSASVAADLFDEGAPPPAIEVGLVTVFSRTMSPMAVSAVPVPRSGANYLGSITSSKYEGIKVNLSPDFAATELTLTPTSKRLHGMFTFGKYIMIGLGAYNLRDIDLSGRKMTGQTFKLTGNTDPDYPTAAGAVQVTVRGTVTKNGRWVNGTFSTAMYTMSDNIINRSGTYTVRRQ
jgi:hypothetical protein